MQVEERFQMINPNKDSEYIYNAIVAQLIRVKLCQGLGRGFESHLSLNSARPASHKNGALRVDPLELVEPVNPNLSQVLNGPFV